MTGHKVSHSNYQKKLRVCMQVCSYRVIASYESPLLEAFSKCILQRHNCLGNSAEIPMVPDPTPLSEFRGAALTWEAAEDIFIGHLSPQAPQTSGTSTQSGFSWRVVCGKNPGPISPPVLDNPTLCFSYMLSLKT